jgi:hypothetical protein
MLAREDPDAQHADAEQAGGDGDRPPVQGPVGEVGPDEDHGPGDQHGGVEDVGGRMEDDTRVGGAQVADLHPGRVGRGVEGLGGDDAQQDGGAGGE